MGAFKKLQAQFQSCSSFPWVCACWLVGVLWVFGGDSEGFEFPHQVAVYFLRNLLILEEIQRPFSELPSKQCQNIKKLHQVCPAAVWLQWRTLARICILRNKIQVLSVYPMMLELLEVLWVSKVRSIFHFSWLWGTCHFWKYGIIGGIWEI